LKNRPSERVRPASTRAPLLCKRKGPATKGKGAETPKERDPKRAPTGGTSSHIRKSPEVLPRKNPPNKKKGGRH